MFCFVLKSQLVNDTAYFCYLYCTPTWHVCAVAHQSAWAFGKCHDRRQPSSDLVSCLIFTHAITGTVSGEIHDCNFYSAIVIAAALWSWMSARCVSNAQTLAERKEEAAWAAAAASLSSSSSLEIHKVIFSRTCVIAVVTSNWYSLRLCGHSNGLLHLLPAVFCSTGKLCVLSATRQLDVSYDK